MLSGLSSFKGFEGFEGFAGSRGEANHGLEMAQEQGFTLPFGANDKCGLVLSLNGWFLRQMAANGSNMVVIPSKKKQGQGALNRFPTPTANQGPTVPTCYMRAIKLAGQSSAQAALTLRLVLQIA